MILTSLSRIETLYWASSSVLTVSLHSHPRFATPTEIIFRINRSLKQRRLTLVSNKYLSPLRLASQLNKKNNFMKKINLITYLIGRS